MVIIEFTNGNIVAVFSEAALIDDNKEANIKNKGRNGAFLAVLNTDKVYYLNKRNMRSTALPYNPYYVMVGNSDLRIKR